MADSSPATPAAAARSLADDVRQRSDEQLARLLTLRQDLARPAPGDLSALAARASTRASVQRAVDALDLAHLAVLEAALVHEGPVDVDDVWALLGVQPAGPAGSPDVADAVTALLADLWDLALVWRSPEGLRVTRTVGEVLPQPAGLGPHGGSRAAEVAARVGDVLADAPQAAGAILDRMTWGPPVATLPAGAPDRVADGARWLLEHHLVAAPSPDQLVLPREVALALRGGRAHRTPGLTQPGLDGAHREPAAVDAAAGQQVTGLLALVDELAAEWGLRPPRVLRAGGLAVRDLRRLASVLDVEESRAGFVTETAYAAGLIADDGALDPAWAPTPGYDDWQQGPGAERWAVLARAWLATTRAPHLVGTTPTGGSGTVNALGPEAHWPPARSLRRDVLTLLDGAPEGLAADADSIAAALRWQRPRRIPANLDTVIRAVLAEAEWLGVTGRGALSSAGRALLRDSDAQGVAAAMQPHLPEPVEHVLLQADLTAIAPGPLEGGLAAFMRLVADVESRGGATVYRFTPDSVRRCLDAGWSVDQVLGALGDASHTPVPQPLDYLVRDLARRHGQARVGTARSYVRCDDEATLGAMLAHRELSPLQLRSLAPTVLVSPVSPDTVLEFLRDNGFAPAAETPEGGVVVPSAGRHRTPRQRTGSPVTASAVDAELVTTLVAALRAGEEAAAYQREALATRPGPSLPSTDPTTTLAVLREAAADRQAVWLGYSDAEGTVRRLLFQPERVEGGRVHGSVDGTARTLSIHRVTGAAPS
ncbi:MAG TPA: helicase-associated domain-containing protein [Pedococcus sp.]|nr:helicase-associated domain-containing protein [Pedococcus sp.]